MFAEVQVEARALQPGSQRSVPFAHLVEVKRAAVSTNPVTGFVQGARRHAKPVLFHVVTVSRLDKADGGRGEAGESPVQALDGDAIWLVDRAFGIHPEAAGCAVDQHLARVVRDCALFEFDAVWTETSNPTKTDHLFDTLECFTFCQAQNGAAKHGRGDLAIETTN